MIFNFRNAAENVSNFATPRKTFQTLAAGGWIFEFEEVSSYG